jgi:DNA-binding response OmpR family regulator
MVGLRQKLGIAAGTPGYIATEPGVGYRLLD